MFNRLPIALRAFLGLQHSLLAGIGQIYFQAAPLTGAVILLSLFLSSPAQALGCIVGVISATVTACAAGFPREQRQQGLYGFNAALSGIGLCSIYQLNPMLLLWIVAAGVLTALISHVFLLWSKLPALTFQFVLLMMPAMIFGASMGLQILPAEKTPGGAGQAQPLPA